MAVRVERIPLQASHDIWKVFFVCVDEFSAKLRWDCWIFRGWVVCWKTGAGRRKIVNLDRSWRWQEQLGGLLPCLVKIGGVALCCNRYDDLKLRDYFQDDPFDDEQVNMMMLAFSLLRL